MVSHLSTAISDLVLALTAVNAAWQLPPFAGILYGRMGFLLIAIAATLGVFRFALSFPGERLIYYHQAASRTAGAAGMALLASAALDVCGLQLLSRLFVGAALGSQLGARHLSKHAETAIVGASVLAIGAASVKADESNGTLAAATILLAGLGVGTDGYLLVVPRVDVFHYLLAATNWLLLQSFRIQTSAKSTV